MPVSSHSDLPQRNSAIIGGNSAMKDHPKPILPQKRCGQPEQESILKTSTAEGNGPQVMVITNSYAHLADHGCNRGVKSAANDRLRHLRTGIADNGPQHPFDPDEIHMVDLLDAKGVGLLQPLFGCDLPPSVATISSSTAACAS